MIRLTLLWAFIGYLGITAWKDRHRSLCGLILLMGVYRHPDMPNSILNIPGLNPWNVLLVVIVIAWLSQPRSVELAGNMPGKFKVLLWLYLFVIIFGFIRMVFNHEGMTNYAGITGWSMPSTSGLWNDYLFNTIKWAVPGILLFDSCRTVSQFKFALVAILGAHFILALQVIQYVPISTLISDIDLSERTVNILRKNVGFHRTDLAVMLAGSFWALVSIRELFVFWWWKICIYPLGLLVFLLAMALTGGRGGYLAWLAIALLFSLIRYRKFLLVLPIMIIIALPYAPSLVNRITEGLNPEEGINKTTLTAGRDIAWPLVIEKIGEAPIVGYGREGMKQTGIATKIYVDYGDSAPHPHNAYLEMLLDNGIIGFVVVISFFLLVMKNSFTLFSDRNNVQFRIIGGVCVALVGSQLIGSLTGQTFYPRELTVGVWCSIGLLLRMIAIRSNQGQKELCEFMHKPERLEG